MPHLNNRYPFAVNSRLALSKNSANGANRANRGAGNPVLGQPGGREHVGAGSKPAPTTGIKFILPGGFLFPGSTNYEILLSKTRPQPPRFTNQQVFTMKMRFGAIKNSANRANRGAGNPVLGQLSGREHVGAGSEPAPTTGKKYILPGGFPLPGQNKLRNFIEQNPTPAAALYQPAIFYTENAFWCYQKMV